jgi:hypothetical protein
MITDHQLQRDVLDELKFEPRVAPRISVLSLNPAS